MPRDNDLLGMLGAIPRDILLGSLQEAGQDVVDFATGRNPGVTGAALGAGLTQLGINGLNRVGRAITRSPIVKQAADIPPQMGKMANVFQRQTGKGIKGLTRTVAKGVGAAGKNISTVGKFVGDTGKFGVRQLGRLGPVASIVGSEILNPKPAGLNAGHEKAMFMIDEPLRKWQMQYKKDPSFDPNFEKLHNLMSSMKRTTIDGKYVDRDWLNSIYQYLYKDPQGDIGSLINQRANPRQPGFNPLKLSDYGRVFDNPDELNQPTSGYPMLTKQREDFELGQELNPDRYADLGQVAPDYSQIDTLSMLGGMAKARGMNKGRFLKGSIATPAGMRAARAAAYPAESKGFFTKALKKRI